MISCEVPFRTLDADLVSIIIGLSNRTQDQVKEALPKPTKVVEFLRMKQIPAEVRLYAVLNYIFLLPKTMRQLACDSAERALQREEEFGGTTFGKSWEAINVARLYSVGRVTQDDLDAANSQSRSVGAEAWAATEATRLSARSAAITSLLYAALAAAVVEGRKYPRWEDREKRVKAEDIAKKKEREWQCEHLAQMLEQES